MEQFAAFVKKEFLHIFRDARSMWIVLAMPVILVLLFGFALTNDIKDAQIAVLDFSKDDLSARVRQRLDSSEYFKLVGEVSGFTEADAVLKSRRAKAVVVFPANFRRDVKTGAKMKIICDASDPNEASNISNFITAISQQEISAEIGGGSPTAAAERTRFFYNPQLKSSYYFVPGVMGVILFLICALLTSVGILRERENGSMEILLVSPVHPFAIVAAKVSPYIFLSLVTVTEILLIVKFVVVVPVAGSVCLLYAVSLLFITLALSLGILISTIANTAQTAIFCVLALLILPTILLSGMVFPIENMPVILQVISNIVPAKWYNIALKDIMLKGLGAAYIIKPVAVLAAMTFAFVALALARFKTKIC